MKRLILFLLTCCSVAPSIAQENNTTVKETTKENRLKQQRNINNLILTDLSLPLTDSTEENYEDAFYAMELTGYRSLWTDRKLMNAVKDINNRSASFQYSLLELLYSAYPSVYQKDITAFLERTDDPKIFALATEYLELAGNKSPALTSLLRKTISRLEKTHPQNGYLQQVSATYLADSPVRSSSTNIGLLLQQILRGEVLLISFQRHNRDYPGIAMIRNADGHWLSTGDSIFYVPQLARSVSNMPFYLTNGNTPQGLFRLNGFDVSKSIAIGPTTNIQMMLPQETTPGFFLKDSTVTDTVWTAALYSGLLPAAFANRRFLFETYIAGSLGRNEIIAHGTTVNAAWYKNNPYYPQTPTQGCLCARETWNGVTGTRSYSDQQQLVNALKIAKGENGYCLVIEIDDRQKTVNINELVHLLPR